jgi:Sporulation and spore germination
MIPRSILIATAVLLIALCGLGFYAFHLKRRAEQLQNHASDNRPIAPPVAGPSEQIILLVARDDDGDLHRTAISAPMPPERSERARHIVRALLDYYSAPASNHPIAERSDVNAVYIVGDNLAVVDMNSAFAEGHVSGILPEELSIASIAETLSANIPTITRVKLLIDGKERDTLSGHADIRTIYEVSAFNVFINPESKPQASTNSRQ